MHPVAKPTHLPSLNSAMEIQRPTAPETVVPAPAAATTLFLPSATIRAELPLEPIRAELSLELICA